MDHQKHDCACNGKVEEGVQDGEDEGIPGGIIKTKDFNVVVESCEIGILHVPEVPLEKTQNEGKANRPEDEHTKDHE